MHALPTPNHGQEPLPFHPLLQEPPRGVPFALAVGVHLLVFLVAFFSPYLFHQRRKIPEVYTVNLYTVQDIGAARLTAPPQAKVTAAPPEVKKAEVKKAEVKTPPLKAEPAPPSPPPAAAPPKAISTQPLPVKSKADLERLKKLKESLNSEERAKEAEKVAQDRTREAVNALKKSIQAQGAAKATTSAPQAAVGTARKGSATGAATGPSGSVMVDEILRRYLLAVNSQVQEHWKLPESQTWKNNLEAIIVIKVRQDGKVIDTFFEHRSESLTFNQYVERAIKEASPLPPFPAGFDQKDLEIGLRFRPGRVF